MRHSSPGLKRKTQEGKDNEPIRRSTRKKRKKKHADEQESDDDLYRRPASKMGRGKRGRVTPQITPNRGHSNRRRGRPPKNKGQSKQTRNRIPHKTSEHGGQVGGIVETLLSKQKRNSTPHKTSENNAQDGGITETSQSKQARKYVQDLSPCDVDDDDDDVYVYVDDDDDDDYVNEDDDDNSEDSDYGDGYTLKKQSFKQPTKIQKRNTLPGKFSSRDGGDGGGSKVEDVTTGRNSLTCEFCEETFQQQSLYEAHMKLHLPFGNRPFRCDECGKTFTEKYLLTKHEKSHSIQRPFACHICGKCLATRKTLKSHIANHTGRKPYKCTMCDKACFYAGQLKDHMLMHKEKKDFVCDLCGKGFPRKSGLEQHLMVHADEKPYHCDQCDKKFRKADELRNHVRYHTGEMPFQCKVCERRFIRPAYLSRHMKVHTTQQNNSNSETGQNSGGGEVNKNTNSNNVPSQEQSMDSGNVDHVDIRKVVKKEKFSGCYGDEQTLSSETDSYAGINSLVNHVGIGTSDEPNETPGSEPVSYVLIKTDLPDPDAVTALQYIDNVGDFTEVSVSPALDTKAAPDSSQAHVGDVTESHTGDVTDVSDTGEHAAVESSHQDGHSTSTSIHSVVSEKEMKNDAQQLTASVSEQVDSVSPDLHDPEVDGHPGTDTTRNSSAGPVDEGEYSYDNGETCFESDSAEEETDISRLLSNMKKQEKKDREEEGKCITEIKQISKSKGGSMEKTNHKPISLNGAGAKIMSCSVNLGIDIMSKAKEQTKTAPTEPKTKEQTPNVPVKEQIPNVPVKEQTPNVPVKEQTPNVPAKETASVRAKLKMSPRGMSKKALNLKDIPCEVCGKMFMFPVHLKLHMVKHTGIRAFQCSICDQKFKSKQAVRLHNRLHTKEKPYKCDICETAFTLKTTLNSHVRTVHLKLRPFQCDTCGKTFGRRSHLAEHKLKHVNANNPKAASEKQQTSLCPICGKEIQKRRKSEHMKSHSEVKQFHCSLCDKSFIWRRSYKRHMATHLAAYRTFKCSLCEKSYSDSYNLKVHMQHTHEEKKFVCTECGKGFPTQVRLEKHGKVHNPNEKLPFPCTQCEKSFHHASGLKSHMIVHNQEKIHMCTMCGDTFSRDSVLRRHMLTHEDRQREKTVPCTMCDKMFVNTYKRDEHMRSHTGKKPYKCEYCGKNYANRKSWKYHIAEHTGNKPHQCVVCGKTFPVISRLQMHQKIHSEKLEICDICGKKFTFKSGLKNHKEVAHSENRVRSFICDICGKSFFNKYALQVHIMYHKNERRYSCEICDRKFFNSQHLRGHMRSHTDDKPYSCAYCDKIFKTPSGLKKHHANHHSFDAEPVENRDDLMTLASSEVNEQSEIVIATENIVEGDPGEETVIIVLNM